MSTSTVEFDTTSIERVVMVPVIELANGEVLFPTEAAAAYTGMTVNALAHRRCRGRSPAFIKRGSRVLYRKSVLDALNAGEPD